LIWTPGAGVRVFVCGGIAWDVIDGPVLWSFMKLFVGGTNYFTLIVGACSYS